MVQKYINNLFIIVIIICSTSLYSLSMMGSGTKIIEFLGIGLIVVLLLLHIVYADQTTFRQNFTWFIILIFLSLITSMLMAKFSWDQKFSETLYAQRAIYYYLFYFLLHQFKVKPEFLERIFIALGVLHVLLYLIQFFLYPKIVFDVFILFDRGTIRIYMKGSDYLVISYFMSIQAFLRTNKIKYLIFTLLFFSIFVLLGGRQTMVIMAFTLILFLIFSKKVKSRLFIGFLIVACVALVFILFQPIFQQMALESKSNTNQGSNYIRVRAVQYFLTDFYKSAMAYIAGNGAPFDDSAYGNKLELLVRSHRYYLSDIGMIGLYIIYGLFFVIGVMGIIIKTLRTKFEDKYIYIKYIFIGSLLSLLTGAGFGKMDFICSLCCLLYIVDVSHHLSSSKEVPDEYANPSVDS